MAVAPGIIRLSTLKLAYTTTFIVKNIFQGKIGIILDTKVVTRGSVPLVVSFLSTFSFRVKQKSNVLNF